MAKPTMKCCSNPDVTHKGPSMDGSPSFHCSHCLKSWAEDPPPQPRFDTFISLRELGD